jgi:predicted Zn-dependent protease
MLQEAAKEFEMEMTLTPHEPFSYENRGQISLDQDQWDEAIKFFRQALARQPKMPKSLAGIGKAYLQKGDTAQAIRYLKEAIALDPEAATFHYQLGQAYRKAGQAEAAATEFATTQRLQAAAREKQAEQLSGKAPLPSLPGQKP